MEIRNLTPHAITFVTDAGDIIKVVEPSGIVARVSAKTVVTGEIAGIPTTATVYGEVVDLPAPEAGVIYVVSSLVASRVPERDDVYIPAESVRDSAGRIVGCKSLGRI